MSEEPRVLHIASEALPFAKTGGLADVASSLPRALRELGVDARLVIPGYAPALRVAGERGLEWLPGDLVIEAGGVDHRLGVGTCEQDGLPVVLLACDELYGREGIYGPGGGHDYDDNARRYSVFAKAALALPRFLGWFPHVVHAHDWQAGLVPPLLERGFAGDLPATRSVFSIHNMAYQGAFWHFDMKLTGLDWSLFNPMQLEHYGELNFLKAGIVFADRVVAVSRRYAREIQEAEYGYGLDAIARQHAYKIGGITNGIDQAAWNPATDPHLPANFDSDDLAGKAVCKRELQRELHLPEDPDTCLVGVVSRLVEQKGIDLIVDGVEPYILDGRMQLAVLGTGDPRYEEALRALQGRHPSRVCFWHGYHEALAHRVEAGSDLFLMPSRYEPCGLNQIYSLRYGTLPLVRFTGGLADTVADVASGEGNGFTFGPVDLGHFSAVLDRALGLFRHYPEIWRQAQRRGMREDHSWAHAAGEYRALYRELVHPG